MSITEIAKRAGVSIATVSRVLNNSPSVRPETARHVQSALKAVAYDTNAIRRGPRLGKRAVKRTRNIGVLVLGQAQETWFKVPLFAAIVSGISRVGGERGLHVLIDEVLDPVESCPSIRNGVLDGALVFVSSTADAKLLNSLPANLPIVRMMGEELPNSPVDQVGADNLAIGRVAFDYLAEQGCERTAYVTTRPDHQVFMLRAMGMLVAAHRAGTALPRGYVVGQPQLTGLMGMQIDRADSLDKLVEILAASKSRPTGLFVSQDAETIGLYPMLVQHGIRPGKDVTIISCNNEQSSLAMLSPRPATIDLGADEIGRWAVSRLISRISHPEESPVRMLVSPKLIAPAEQTPMHM